MLTDNFLLVADASGIWQMTLDGNSATFLPIGTDVNAVAMDYDPIAQTVYWMDVVNDAVNNVSISVRFHSMFHVSYIIFFVFLYSLN